MTTEPLKLDYLGKEIRFPTGWHIYVGTRLTDGRYTLEVDEIHDDGNGWSRGTLKPI